MGLSYRDLKSTLKIIDLIYTLSDRKDLLESVFQEAEKLIGISSGVYLPIDPQTHTYHFPGPITYNVPSDSAKPWVNYYNQIDPLVTGWQGEVNIAVQNTDILPASRLADSEFNQDFLAPLHIFCIIGAYLGSQGDPVGLFGFHRPKNDRPFSKREKKSSILFCRICRMPCIRSGLSKPSRPFKASA